MKLKTWQKNILSMIAIIVIGFVLFNAAFLLAAVMAGAVGMISGGQAVNPHFWMYVYLIIILLLSWFILKSRLSDLIKAIYMTVPLMVVLVLEGIFLYTRPQWIIFCFGAVIVGAVLFYLYKQRLSWLYYFSTAYVAILAFCVMFFKIEI